MAGTGCMTVMIFGVLTFGAEEQSDVFILQQAESAFARGLQTRAHPVEAKESFKEASNLYKLLVKRGARSSALFQDFGNAALLADDLPGAILAYRTGLQWSPNDRQLQTSISFARAQVAYPDSTRFARPLEDRRPSWLPGVAPAWQWLSATLAYCATWLLLTRWWVVRNGRSFAVVLLAAGVAAGLCVNVLFEAQQNRLEMLHPVVVIADDGVLMRNGNGLSYPVRYETPLNRGVEARLLYERGRWLQIELSGGEVGWVPAEYAIYLKD